MTGPERARRDLAEVLADGRLPLAEAQARMAEAGHPAGRTDRARRSLKIETVREGAPGTRQRFFWRLPDACPVCRRPYRPDATPAPTPWGMNRDGDGDYWRDDDAAVGPAAMRESVPPNAPPAAALEPHEGPPRCDRCGKHAAVDRGSPCCYWPGGRRCAGVMR